MSQPLQNKSHDYPPTKSNVLALTVYSWFSTNQSDYGALSAWVILCADGMSSWITWFALTNAIQQLIPSTHKMPHTLKART